MIFQNLDRLESTIGGDIIPQAKITYQVEVLSEFNLFIKTLINSMVENFTHAENSKILKVLDKWNFGSKFWIIYKNYISSIYKFNCNPTV